MAVTERSRQRDMWGLVALLTGSGLLHLARPRIFEAIVPRFLPAKQELVYASGVVELACAAGMAWPITRRPAGLLAAGLLVAVFPANVQMTVDVLRGRSRIGKALALARLPLQVPLVRAAWRAGSERHDSAPTVTVA